LQDILLKDCNHKIQLSFQDSFFFFCNCICNKKKKEGQPTPELVNNVIFSGR
jgi:hypothetical protein